ncbi:MAG: acyl carrier protein [Eubacteriales bacterium]
MVFEKVQKILSEQLEISKDKITMESNLIEDLKADSLDIVELIMDLEQEFDLEIPDDDLPKVIKVADVVKYIESKLE